MICLVKVFVPELRFQVRGKLAQVVLVSQQGMRRIVLFVAEVIKKQFHKPVLCNLVIANANLWNPDGIVAVKRLSRGNFYLIGKTMPYLRMQGQPAAKELIIFLYEERLAVGSLKACLALGNRRLLEECA